MLQRMSGLHAVPFWAMLLALLFSASVDSFSATPPTEGFAGVRFSLYPKVKGDQSLREAIKNAVRGIPDLGLEVRPDDVSSSLHGPEPALFEAVRAAFGRACRVEGEPHVAMVCAFSAGRPGGGEGPDDDDDDAAAAAAAPPLLPPRTVNDGELSRWIDDAFDLPSRVACQFAVYPLGNADYATTIYEVIEEAKKSPSYKEGGKTRLCSMLDGDGVEVFDVIRSCFDLARQKHAERGGGHVTMTATFTAQKAAWK
mmetsp:Transcript_39678/g.119207  ORF Transcript_39678/g.119207 Transcript_39678/m.119207 type:complete len:255 (-) Transcript_39678:508-1272(-)